MILPSCKMLLNFDSFSFKNVFKYYVTFERVALDSPPVVVS